MKISVVIPCHNSEQLLGATLGSVLNQTLPPAEIIVVDDGSTDGSLALARSYGGIVSAISAPSGGASAARNKGMAMATGDAVMFLDSDDLLGRTVLENLAAALEQAPDAVACCPWYRLEERNGCWLSAPASCAPRRAGQDDLSAWLTGWYHPPCSVLWSRDAYARSAGWDPDIKVNTDGDIMMRGFIAGNRLARSAAGASYYRRLPGGQVSLSGTRATRQGIESRLKVIRRVALMLRERSRLARYRPALGEAYMAIAADCDAYPQLRAECLRAAEEYAGRRWRRRLRRLPTRVARKLGYLQRHFERALGPPSTIALATNETAVEQASDDRPRATVIRKGRSDPPKVTVVIPTYNRANLLARTLKSAFGQSYENLEVLLVDDGSTDGTPELVRRYDDPRLRYLRHDRNRGVGAARNRGMREASGSLIAFLDSDDEWLPHKISRQVALFAESSRAVGLVYCGVETVDGTGHTKIDLPSLRGNLHDQLLLRNVLVGGSCAMIRRDVISTVGYFDESLPAIEDYEFWLRIARFYSFDFVAAPLVRYHDRIPGGPGSDDTRRSRDFVANFTARQTFYERNRHEMEQAGVEHLFLLESAKRHLGWPFGNPDTGRRLLLRAMARRPGARELYPWVGFAFLPNGTRPLAAAVARRRGELTAIRRRPSATEEAN